MAARTLVTIVAGAILVAGCVGSPRPPTSKDVAAAYKEVTDEYARDAVDQPPFKTSDQYIRSGLRRVDQDCDAFFRNLSEYNRRASSAQNGIHLLSGTTAGVLAATDTAAKSISLTALGFIGIESQVKNYRDYELLAPFSGNAQDLIDRARASYRKQPWPTDVMDAATFVGGYAKLCTYDSIQRYINDAVKKADVGLKPSEKPATISAEERATVVAALPSVNLEPLTDAQWARLYWFLTDGLTPAAPRKQFSEEFPDLAALLTDPAKPSTLSSLGEQVVAQLRALAIRDSLFKELVAANIKDYAQAQAQADAAVKAAAKDTVQPAMKSLSDQVKSTSRDLVEGRPAPAPAGPRADPVKLAAELAEKAETASANPVRLPAAAARTPQWGGPAEVVIK